MALAGTREPVCSRLERAEKSKLEETMKLLSALAVAAAVSLAMGSFASSPGTFIVEAQAKGKKKVKKKKPGTCGTYNYWKAGKCIDARVTPVKK
jgi:nitrous oxide reductase